MTETQLGGATLRAKVNLEWKINGHSITHPDRLGEIIAQPARRLTDATRRIKAHIKAHVGPKAAFRFTDPEIDLTLGRISASMGAAAFNDSLDNIPTLRYKMGSKDNDNKVEVDFVDITSGGKRHGKTRRSRKARSTRRRA
jgi:hypothetical protein